MQNRSMSGGKVVGMGKSEAFCTCFDETVKVLALIEPTM
jgi:hypothetical protein